MDDKLLEVLLENSIAMLMLLNKLKMLLLINLSVCLLYSGKNDDNSIKVVESLYKGMQ